MPIERAIFGVILYEQCLVSVSSECVFQNARGIKLKVLVNCLDR
jgi:hypothetical protein